MSGTKIGFIGAGAMGMGTSIVRAGFVKVYEACTGKKVVPGDDAA